jgi:hypothetical protein
MDEDPSNHDARNLVVLCLDCHQETQVKGGFSRRLDLDQIRLYRDSWNQAVAAERSTNVDEEASGLGGDVFDAELATSLVEVNREAENWVNLAFLYNAIGNDELRDKAIETAISNGVTDQVLVLLRRVQGRVKDVPGDVIEAELERLADENSFRLSAVLLEDLGSFRRAAEAYLTGISNELSKYEDFTLAFYLKEMADTKIIPGLFLAALQEAADEDDLWWQVRALEELGWTTELHALVVDNRDRIEVDKELVEDQRCRLRIILAEATGDEELLRQSHIELEQIEASIDWND